MTIYCPTCNRSSDDTRFIGNFCEFCIIKKLERDFPTHVRVLTCRLCGKIKEGNTFVPFNNKSFGNSIAYELKLKGNWHVKVKAYNDRHVDVMVTAPYENEKVVFPMRLNYKFGHETCQRCDRVSGGYYEAVVQLRGNWDKINNLIPKIERYITRRDGFIAKIEKVEGGGKDLYISDKLMTSEFFHDYGLKPTRSFRLYGMKRGKRLYRNTYSLHL